MYEHRGGAFFKGIFPPISAWFRGGGSNSMREGGRVEGILREIQGGFKGS